jgi:hypothetical protein
VCEFSSLTSSPPYYRKYQQRVASQVQRGGGGKGVRGGMGGGGGEGGWGRRGLAGAIHWWKSRVWASVCASVQVHVLALPLGVRQLA